MWRRFWDGRIIGQIRIITRLLMGQSWVGIMVLMVRMWIRVWVWWWMIRALM